MQDIQELYEKAYTGQRMLLIRNMDMTTLAPNIKPIWPEQLRDQSIVYGVFDGEQLGYSEFYQH